MVSSADDIQGCGMIIYVSDINVEGSGYSSIGVKVCSELAKYDKVVALSFTYTGEEHHYPFSLVPVKANHIPLLINALCGSKEADVKHVFLATDIPYIIDIVKHLEIQVPVHGIFPVESDPLCEAWTIGLWNLASRFVISEFGVATCAAKGLEAVYFPIPANEVFYYIPDFDRGPTRAKYGLDNSHFVILTVADNHERKNLSRSMEIFAKFAEDIPEARYIIVTRKDSRVGWKLKDLARTLGIKDKYIEVYRGMPDTELADLYRASDVFLLTSKAEGAGLCIREAQACGTIVAATNCTAITEQISDGRGYPIEWDYRPIDVWGNSYRYFASISDGVNVLRHIYDADKSLLNSVRNRALNYTRGFSWEKSVNRIITRLGL